MVSHPFELYPFRALKLTLKTLSLCFWGEITPIVLLISEAQTPSLTVHPSLLTHAMV